MPHSQNHSSLCQDGRATPNEPIAIVGMGMRLPGGVHSTEGFWDMLVNKRDGRCPVPRSRYNVDAFFDASRDPTTGYFLQEDPAYFDAPFFSITPQVAKRMDPQQRLLLEVVWECFENAGETNWRGKNVGCYVGVFGEDWLEVSLKGLQPPDRYHAIGTGGFALANRVSYEFDLRGPSMTIQTGCSASLVGLHEACQALRSGECSAAIAAGTNLIWSPTMTTAMNINTVLSPTGTCRTFDAKADGYGRGEAINAIYIKRLSDALQDRDTIRAIIRSTATNSDGNTQTITQPCPIAQERLIRSAYRQGKLGDIHQTGFFECHGTGTVIGDSVEMSVVAKVFGEAGITIGGVKPNVGHSEGASGLTSVIKSVMALEYRSIPPNIHFDTPNPHIAFQESKLHIPLEVTPWPEHRHERVSINCFGIGGSNAHVILDSATSITPSHRMEAAPERSQLLVVSANSVESLQKRIRELTRYANNHLSSLHDLSYTLGVRREHLKHRAFAVAHPNLLFHASTFETLQCKSPSPKATFVFTGQGAQWAGMGKALLDTEVSFTEVIEEMDEALRRLEDAPEWSLKEEMCREPTLSRINEVGLAQPLCTALQVGLVKILTGWGIEPQSVVGHSSGEIAAAYAAGAISANSAIIIAYYRGKLARAQEGLGAMAAVGLSRLEITPHLQEGVVVACENSPQNVTLSGDKDAMDQVLKNITAENPDTFHRRLPIRIAYHSPHMSDIGSLYESAIAHHISYGSQMLPMTSSVTREVIIDPRRFDAAYWRQNLESPVLFSSAVQGILRNDKSNRVFIEIGPHSALSVPLRQIFQMAVAQPPPVYIPTLARNDDDARSLLLTAAGRVFTTGISVNLFGIVGLGNLLTNLPRYPWKHDTRYWDEGRPSRDWRLRSLPHHELLGSRVLESTTLEPAWRNQLHLDDVLWLSEHVLQGQVTFPGAGYIAMAGEAAQQIHTDMSGYSLRNVQFKVPLLLDGDGAIEMITKLKPVELADGVISDWYTFTVAAYDGISWTLHCQGQVRAGYEYPLEPKEIHPLPRSLESKRWYQTIGRRGLRYGPRFQGLQNITADPTRPSAVATVIDPRGLHESRYTLHPVAIDQCLQLFGIALSSGLTYKLDRMYIPAMIESIVVEKGAPEITVQAETHEGLRGGQCGDAIGMVENQAIFAIKGGFLFGVDDPTANGANVIRLASRMDWRADIDLFPPADLLPASRRDIDHELFMGTGGMGYVLYVIATADRIRNVTSQIPHLNKWKAWVLSEAEAITTGTRGNFLNLARWVENITLEAPSIHTLKDSLRIVQQIRFAASPQRAQIDLIRQAEQIEQKMDNSSKSDHIILLCVKQVFQHCLEFMSGKRSPLETLMEGSRLEQYYKVSWLHTDWSIFMGLLCHSNPTLRVLEIGAGTGFATEKALSYLKSSGGVRMYSHYVFTDISPGFMAKAQEKFDQERNMEYRTLDISQDPEAQGFEPHSFDLIIASNVLHATPSLQTSLQHVHKLLASNGRLLLHELHPETLCTDYIMGVLPGWWLGEGDARPDQPYVSPERWDRELRSAGFTGAEVVECGDSSPFPTSVSIISRPASQTSSLPKEITLLTQVPSTGWAREVEESFQYKGYTVYWATLSQPPQNHRNIVSLLDIETPYFGNLSKESFNTLQRFLGQSRESRLLWVTQETTLACSNPRFGTIHGLARSLRQEMSLDISVVEVDRRDSVAARTLVELYEKIQNARQLSHLNVEYEFVLNDGIVYIGRAHWTSLSEQLSSIPLPHTPRKLDIGSFGQLETLQWVPKTINQPLGSGEVEVDIHYVGLNFRDLMISMGLVGSREELGIEATGIVNEVASDVIDLKAGDRVAMVGFGLLCTRTVIHQKDLLKFPDSFPLEDAAAMLSVYLTAIYSLVHIGNLQKDQSVLIHSAAGGVGLASINICRILGAEIYVTVGNEEKAKYLMETFGIPRDHIFHSRDSSFTPGIMRATNGRGVDIVLNSLAGKLLHSSWECVAPHGKMIELGKRDFLTHGVLSMSPFLANRTFYGVDLLQICQEKHDIRASLVNLFFDFLQKGAIRPIRPLRIFEAARVAEALRYLQTGTHMGKVVIQMTSNATDLPCTAIQMAPSFTPDASYLLVGGLGGIGRAVSTWLVEHGARELVYLSRSAGRSDNDQAFIRELEVQGCRVICVVGTVTDLSDVKRAVSQCTNHLAGIVQMAINLDDRTFQHMTHEQWMAAMAPKVDGTWNLHRAVEGEVLDFFVMFGSAVGTTGARGQANYAAANAFLDAFAQYRRQRGLAASVINFGPVEDIGMVSRCPEYLQNAQISRIPLLCETNVLEALHVAIRDSPSDSKSCTLGVGFGHTKPISEDSVLPMWGRDARFSLYANLQSTVAVQAQGGGDRLRSIFNQVDQDSLLLDDAETTNALRRELGRMFAQNFMPGKELDEKQQAGIAIDSLMAIEIKNLVRRAIRTEISLGEISKVSTVGELSDLLVMHLRAKYKLDEARTINL